MRPAKKVVAERREAVRKWLATYGPWHGQLPAGIDCATLNIEMGRLLKAGVLDVWSWEVDGETFEPEALPESKLLTTRIYTPGPRWSAYVKGEVP